MAKCSFFVGIFFLISVNVFAQKIELDVLMGDKKIGEIKTEKKAKGKTASYTLSSTVDVTMLFKVQVTTLASNTFTNGLLTTSQANRKSNMQTENKTTATIWKAKAYEINRDNVIATLTEPVKYCVTNLYFEEPVNQQNAFSEIQALQLPIKSLGNHEYEISQPGGKKDVYTYVNGKLQKVMTVIAMKQVEFRVR